MVKTWLRDTKLTQTFCQGRLQWACPLKARKDSRIIELVHTLHTTDDDLPNLTL